MQNQKPSGGGWQTQSSSKTNPHLVSGLPFTLVEPYLAAKFGLAGCGYVCICVCVCVLKGGGVSASGVVYHFGIAIFLVVVPAITWLGKPWQFIPSMWPCIVQGALHAPAIPIVFLCLGATTIMWQYLLSTMLRQNGRCCTAPRRLQSSAPHCLIGVHNPCRFLSTPSDGCAEPG